MRIVLLFLTVFVSIFSNAQAVFEIESPSKIKGFYNLGLGDSTVQYWGNGSIAKKSVSAPLALGKDSLAEDQVLSTDLTGKIAVLYRGGGIAFCIKALRAQNAGAVACIIINNRPFNDPTGQGGVWALTGTASANETYANATGLKVKIPVILISQEDGQKISDVIREGQEDVMAYIGGKRVLDYDIKFDKSYIVTPLKRTRPQFLARKGMIHDTLGYAIINAGSQLQTNILAVADISFGGKSIYADTLYLDTLRERGARTPDDAYPLDTLGYFKFKKVFKPDFDLPVGDYTLKYSFINLTSDLKRDTLIDQYPADNSFSTYFTIADSTLAIANIENLQAKYNSNNKDYSNVPIWVNATRPGGTFTDFKSCIVISDSNSVKVKVNSINFLAYATDASKPNLTNELIKLNVYEWHPVTPDPSSKDFTGLKTDDLTALVENQEYTITNSTKWDYINAKFDNPILMENGKLYLYCISSPNTTISFGYDGTSPSITGAVSFGNQLAVPVGIDGTYYTVGFRGSPIPSISLNVSEVAAKSSAKDILALSVNTTPVVNAVVGVNTITATVPNKTDITKLIATFTTSLKAKVTIAAVDQVSGTTVNDFTNTLVYTVTAEDGTTKDYNVTITLAPKSSEKDITSFSYGSSSVTYGVIKDSTILLNVPSGTDLTKIVVTFTSSTGSTVAVGATTQVSNTTSNDFTAPVKYVVTAEDGSTKTYTVTVSTVKSSLKSFITFGIASPIATGVINGTNITVSLPRGSTVDHLTAKFTVSPKATVSIGSTAQTSNVTVNDFTAPVTYTVTAEDGSTRDYVVTVVVLKSSAKDLTSFGFVDPNISGTISGTNIVVNVPVGSNISGLVAKFTASAYSTVSVNSLPQVSGTTVNDFTNTVNYLVTAEDGSTKTYAVTVNEVNLSSAKDILSFGFDNPKVLGTIVGNNISVEMVDTINVKALIAVFTVSPKATVSINSVNQVSGTTSNDFTSTLSYVVKAEDGTTKTYTVTVSLISADASKDITSFEFKSPVAKGVINGTNITLDVPVNTDLTNLIASFTLSSKNATVSVNSVDQVSGVTANNFTSPVVYVVKAKDNTVKSYTVTVNNKHAGINVTSLNTMKVYPNPSTGLFTVATEKGSLSIKVTDLSGKLVYQLASDFNMNDTFNLDLSHVENGSYIATIENNGISSITNIQVVK